MSVRFLASYAALNPDPRYPPVLDPKDQALLFDPGSSASSDYGRHHGHHGPGTPPMPASVSWLRKTEYISRDSSAPSHRPAATDMFVISSLSHDCDFPPPIPYTFLQNELPERGSGHIARGTTRIHREFFRRGARHRAAKFTATSDQTASARC
jgi:hypothetical protein